MIFLPFLSKWALFSLNAISKQKKMAIPDWRQMKVLSKGFQMTQDSKAKLSLQKSVFLGSGPEGDEVL